MDEINKKRAKRIFIIAGIILGIAFWISAISYQLKNTDSLTEEISASDKAKADSIEHAKSEAAAANNKYQWRYSEETDPMTSGKKYYAQIYSTTWLSFQFPYNGGSEVDFFIRNVQGENEAILRVSKGQFLTSFDSGKNVRIRFDQDQPITIGYNSASDGSTDVIFLDNPDEIIRHIKKSNSFLIEVAFYQEGNKHLEFAYRDFKWNH